MLEIRQRLSLLRSCSNVQEDHTTSAEVLEVFLERNPLSLQKGFVQNGLATTRLRMIILVRCYLEKYIPPVCHPGGNL